MDKCASGDCIECPAYERQIVSICNAAIQYFDDRVHDNIDSKKPRLVVFDIDGTALDDRRSGRRPRGLKRHDPVHKLYLKLIELKYEIVFLTGRVDDPNYKKKTIDNLVEEGYTKMADIILCPCDVRRDPHEIGVWKDFIRDSLKQRYELVAVVGDQPMDTEGLHIGEYQVRLPIPPNHQLCCIQ
jgi:predicted secreted acid phosphatase